MASDERLPITMSSNGQVALMSAERQQYAGGADRRLMVEEASGSVLLKSSAAFAPTRPEDVFGSLPHRGEFKTVKKMDTGVLAEARRRHPRA